METTHILQRMCRLCCSPLLDGEADMTVATRLNEYEEESFRPLHVFGNNLVRSLVNWIFNSNLEDIMSGYRGFQSGTGAESTGIGQWF
jgi:hypothetical protein